MRTTYKTDVSADDPEYIGAFSAPFPAPSLDREIVNVDWAVKGVVEVTWLVDHDLR